MMDSLLSLRVFAAVAELRSFAAAAERLELSAAMASKHVQKLEQRLATRLLHRTSRSVSLTEDGVIYLERVRRLIEGLDDVEAQIGESRQVPRGTLRISAPQYLANPGFSQCLVEYAQRYPNVKMDIDLEGRVVNLAAEGFDIALRTSYALDEGLIARKLGHVPFHLAAAPCLLEKLGRPEQISDLNDKPFLCYSPYGTDGRIRYEDGNRIVELQFKPVFCSDHEQLLLQCARKAMGFLFLPAILAEEEFSHGRLERVLPSVLNIAPPLYAVYSSSAYLPAKIRTFLDFIRHRSNLGWLINGDETTSEPGSL